jgi:transposase
LLSQIYQVNRHDSRIFSCILAELIVALRRMLSSESDIVIVLDKGNNSEKNFKAMYGEISWVGALAPSHHKDLMELDPSLYDGTWKDLCYRRISRNIMGIECAVLITYNSSRARKQEHSLQRGIERLKKEILDRWNSYKKAPQAITRGITSIQKKSDYGACLKPSVSEGGIQFELDEAELGARRKRFGKNIIFSDMLTAESSYLIETYRQRSRIETDFQLLKDETIIRFRPIRHWTDTKIRAHAFCCVMALTLMRVMQWKAHKIGHRMSPMLLKEELGDINEVVMVYNATKARTKITDRSTVQEKLWQAFRLDEIQQLVLH